MGIFRNLQDALRIYAKPNQPGQLPIKDKAALVAQLEGLLRDAQSLCTRLGIDLSGIVNTPPAQRLEALQKAMDVILEAGEDKTKAYLLLAGQVARTFKAILPDAEANAHAPTSVLVAYLGAMIKALRPPPDISGVMNDLDALLDDSIATEGYRIGARPAAEALIDLSQIDFAALQKKFEDGKKATETEKLKGQIEKKLDTMVRENKGRIDFLEKFQKLIESYNSSSHNLEAFFKELMHFAQNLTQEEQRATRENLSEEELAIFDLLTQPEPELTEKEKGRGEEGGEGHARQAEGREAGAGLEAEDPDQGGCRADDPGLLHQAAGGLHAGAEEGEAGEDVCPYLRELLWGGAECVSGGGGCSSLTRICASAFVNGRASANAAA